MKYILGNTRVVHWDAGGLSKINPDSDQIMQGLVNAEMFIVNYNKLPIIIEGEIRILDGDEIIFSCIFHTKALLTFDINENPILDLISMFDETFTQEQEIWMIRTEDTILEGTAISKAARDSETRFNKAYQVMEHARKRHLLAGP